MKKLILACILLFSSSIISISQAPPAPSPKKPETGPDVDLLHHLRRSTVSLGIHLTEKGVEHFASVGSAVIVAWDENHACLLTAKHIFYYPEKNFFPTVLYLRIPQSEPRAQDDLGVALPLVENGTTLWRGSDDADLAVVRLPDLRAYGDLHGISFSDFGDENDTFQGASVVVLGYPELLVRIPMKVISDSDWIPVTGSEMKLIVFGAKRRWRSYRA